MIEKYYLENEAKNKTENKGETVSILNKKNMNLITRSDFDGLVTGTLLKKAGIIDTFSFVHPKDVQDGKVTATANDIVTNLTYIEGCGAWFDHHHTEIDRKKDLQHVEGVVAYADSAARIVYDYLGGCAFFTDAFDALMEAVDKIDAAKLEKEDILNPTGWILLGFLTDARTGLGRIRNFTISNYQLMEKLLEACQVPDIERIIALPDVQERVVCYHEQATLFKDMVKQNSRVEGKVLITDLREVETIYVSNRFAPYAMYPEANLSAWIVPGLKGQGCAVAVGHSIINQSSQLNVGDLMKKYEGGGHIKAGTFQLDQAKIDAGLLDQALTELVSLNR